MTSLSADMLASRPSGEVWLFAYGSLIWKPEVEHSAERMGRARGWHRVLLLSGHARFAARGSSPA